MIFSQFVYICIETKSFKTMNNKTNPLLISSMTYGLYLGIAMVIFSLMLFILGILPVGFGRLALLFLFSSTIMFLGIFFATKKIRDVVFSGQITFGKAFQIGILVVLFASVISAVYSYIQNAIIDPDYVSRLMNAWKEWMYEFMKNMNASEIEIDKKMDEFDMQIKEFSYFKNFFKEIFSSIFWGAIISLITAAILKKKKDNPFTDSQVIE